MNSMFGPETKFFKVTNQIGNILLVSVLWLIGCIPVITIGTSTIAMYYAMVKAVRCEEGYVTKEFFRSYRQNLKTGIVLTVIFPGLAAVLWLDHSYTVKQVSIVAGALEMVYLLLAFVIAGIVLYLFPYCRDLRWMYFRVLSWRCLWSLNTFRQRFCCYYLWLLV